MSKTAQDACLYISEPPQSPTKPRGGKKGSGLPETTLAAAEALPASVTRKKDAGSQTAEGNRAPRAEGQPAPDAVAATPKHKMPMQRPQSAASTRSARSASGDSHRSTSTGASRLRADHVWLQPLPGVGSAEQIAAIQDALSPSKADARLSTATPVKPTRSQRRSSNETPRPRTAPARRGESAECLSPEKFAALSHPSSGAPEVDAFTMKRMQSPLRDRDVKGRERRAAAQPSPVIQQKKLREEAIQRRPSQIQQKQMREDSQPMRRASRDEPAKKKTKKPVPELQLEPESPVAQRRVEAYGSVRKSTSASVDVHTSSTA